MAKLLPDELVSTSTIDINDLLVVQKNGETSVKYITGANAAASLDQSQLELITDNGNSGWRLLGKNPSDYVVTGNLSVDFSTYDDNSYKDEGGAGGDYSFASGLDTVTYGNQSHVEGHGGEIHGNDGHAQNHYGYIGPNAHACHVGGFGATVSMLGSNASSLLNGVVGGTRVIPPGGGATEFEGATAIGMHTFAKGDGHFVSGYGTASDDTDTRGKHVIGAWNDTRLDTILEVGIGDDDLDRFNGFEVHTNGEVVAPTLSTFGIDNAPSERVLITKEYADANYSGGGGGGSSVTSTTAPQSNGNYYDDEYLLASWPYVDSELVFKYNINIYRDQGEVQEPELEDTHYGMLGIPQGELNATVYNYTYAYNTNVTLAGKRQTNSEAGNWYNSDEIRMHTTGGVTYLYAVPSAQGNDYRYLCVWEVLPCSIGLLDFSDYPSAV